MARGGARMGAGRKRDPGKPSNETRQQVADDVPSGPVEQISPLDYLLKIMNDPSVSDARRDRAAIAAAPFMHAKQADAGGGKKAAAQARAAEIANGAAPGAGDADWGNDLFTPTSARLN